MRAATGSLLNAAEPKYVVGLDLNVAARSAGTRCPALSLASRTRAAPGVMRDACKLAQRLLAGSTAQANATWS